MKVLVFIFLSFICCRGLSQVTDSILPKGGTESYFSFAYDNDFFSATDRYYTQGIIVSLVHPSLRHSPLFFLLPKLRASTKNYFGLHLEQDVFTPRSIRYKEGAIYYGERPFTALFFVSHSLKSLNEKKNLLLNSNLDLGILGPAALGEQEQKGIHKALNNIEPQGWSNQLSQDFILNYTGQIEKGLWVTKFFELMVNGTGRLGTLYTDGAVGLHARLGIFTGYFANLGLPERKKNRTHDFYAWLVLKANTKLVGYNATLQGGLSNSGNIYELSDNSITRVVNNLSAGIVVNIKRLSLEYSRTYVTKEFEDGVDHGWGRVSFLLSF